jgi:hypothetical protein
MAEIDVREAPGGCEQRESRGTRTELLKPSLTQDAGHYSKRHLSGGNKVC